MSVLHERAGAINPVAKFRRTYRRAIAKLDRSTRSTLVLVVVVSLDKSRRGDCRCSQTRQSESSGECLHGCYEEVATEKICLRKKQKRGVRNSYTAFMLQSPSMSGNNARTTIYFHFELFISSFPPKPPVSTSLRGSSKPKAPSSESRSDRQISLGFTFQWAGR